MSVGVRLFHSRVEVVVTWEVSVHDKLLHPVAHTVKQDILREKCGRSPAMQHHSTELSLAFTGQPSAQQLLLPPYYLPRAALRSLHTTFPDFEAGGYLRVEEVLCHPMTQSSNKIPHLPVQE